MSDETPGTPNPRGRRPGERRLTPRPPVGAAMWYVLGFLILAAAGQLIFFTLYSGETLPYSQFKALLRQGKVQEVVVAEDRIRGTIKGDDGKPKAFVAVRIEDPKLVEDLEQQSVKYTGEIANRWIAEILGWIIPLVFLIALFSVFFRRMGGAEGGVMSFARSRAKI